MRVFRWEISRNRAFLIGGAVLIGIVVLIIAMTNISGPSSFTVSSNKEIGTWVWDPIAQMPTSAMSQLIDQAADAHFNTIYLSVDSYLDIQQMPSAARADATQQFESAVYNFISLAHQKNIVVDAEGGANDWGEPQHYQNAYAIFDFVQSFNASHDGKFRGVQYDVESYSLPQYGSDPATVLTRYVGLVSGLVDRDKTAVTPIPVTMIVPYFYTSDHGSSPQITINGKTDYAYNQIVSLLNELPSGDGRVMVLAYRNIASGDGGAINLAQAEVQAADQTNVKVVIAQETGDVQPASITFYGMPKDSLYEQVKEIDDAFSSNRSYGGIAVDYLQAFTALR